MRTMFCRQQPRPALRLLAAPSRLSAPGFPVYDAAKAKKCTREMGHQATLLWACFASLLLLMSTFSGCGHAAGSKDKPTTFRGLDGQMRAVNAGNLSAASRYYYTLDEDQAERATLREAILRHLDKAWRDRSSSLGLPWNEAEDADGATQGAAVAGQGLASSKIAAWQALVAHFAEMIHLYETEELAKAEAKSLKLSPSLRFVARQVVALGSPMGKEGETLAALWVLARTDVPENEVDTDDAKKGDATLSAKHFEAKYKQLKAWGYEVRRSIPDPIERITGLIGAWDTHAELTPSPGVLRRAATLHSKRRALALQQRQGLRASKDASNATNKSLGAERSLTPPSEHQGSPDAADAEDAGDPEDGDAEDEAAMLDDAAEDRARAGEEPGMEADEGASMATLQRDMMRMHQVRFLESLILRAPLEVVALYLRAGDLQGAIAAVKGMAQQGRGEAQIIEILEQAARDDTQGHQALFELAETFRANHPEVSMQLCRRGQRAHPGDVRFPLCLARIAAQEESLGDAATWFRYAVAVTPEERIVYDEALSTLGKLIQGKAIETSVDEARALAEATQEILAARQKRFPDKPSPLRPEMLELLFGRLEMNAGNPKVARTHFEQSIKKKPSAQAWMELGTLEARTGSLDDARRALRQAVTLLPSANIALRSRRAEAIELLGDVQRRQGRADEATASYRKALALWSTIGEGIEGSGMAALSLRMGVLHDRIGERNLAIQRFREAMTLAPKWREVYTVILSHLVISNPDHELALDVLRRAQRNLTLEPEWKVYFSLWVATISGRAGEALDDEVTRSLETLGKPSTWWASLAKFGLGHLPVEVLLQQATNDGEKAEAYFYAGAKHMSEGRHKQATRYFHKVINTNMVNFYEFSMAQELLPALKHRRGDERSSVDKSATGRESNPSLSLRRGGVTP